MQWDFPVPAGQQVQVRLYLANRYTGTATAGKRIFDVSIDGLERLNDFDPVVEAGGTDRGTMRAFTITSDGNVDVDFGRVVENPLVQAIELVKRCAAAQRGGAEQGHQAVVRRRLGGGYGRPGDRTPTAPPGRPSKGGFWVGGTLYYGMNGSLYRRSLRRRHLRYAEQGRPVPRRPLGHRRDRVRRSR